MPETATIAVDGERVRLEKMVYYAVNKPKGYVSTNNDPAGRPRVIDLLPEVPERVYSVGRLDEDSMGLMILTNDGELANRLAHPRYGVEKTYRALVAGTPGREILDKLTEGIWLSDGKVRAKRARFAGTQGEATTLELVLAEGKKREIRRMLAKLGHKVMSLTRIAIGPVLLKGLSAGRAPAAVSCRDRHAAEGRGGYRSGSSPSPRSPRRPRPPLPDRAGPAATTRSRPRSSQGENAPVPGPTRRAKQERPVMLATTIAPRPPGRCPENPCRVPQPGKAHAGCKPAG